MPSLREIAQARPALTLDAFVETANALLPDYLPDDPTSGRPKTDVNARLIRHYTSEGLLDEPLKEGREARYSYPHLLQLLVVRRLLAEGLTSAAIGDLVRRKDSDALERMLEGGVKIEIAPYAPAANDALDFLDRIRQRKGAPADPTLGVRRPPSAPTPTPTPTPAPSGETRWDRYELIDGVELHVRSDARLPASPQAQRNLLALLTRKLIDIAQRRRP